MARKTEKPRGKRGCKDKSYCSPPVMALKVNEMVGVKGMKVNHRAFTYEEKKFNSYGRSGLLNLFSPKVSPETIQQHFWDTRKVNVRIGDARNMVRFVERNLFEDEKESITALVDSILTLANRFDITNIEAYAMTCYLYKAVGAKGELNQRQVGEIMDRVLPEVNELRLENWDKFMRILKEVT